MKEVARYAELRHKRYMHGYTNKMKKNEEITFSYIHLSRWDWSIHIGYAIYLYI